MIITHIYHFNMKTKYITSDEKTVTLEVDGNIVTFQKVSEGENFVHSQEWLMDGYTGTNVTHTAIASFSVGTEQFETITYIEKL